MSPEGRILHLDSDPFRRRPFVQGEIIMPPDILEQELLSSNGVGIVQRIRVVGGLPELENFIIPARWAVNFTTDGGFEYVSLNGVDQSGAAGDSKETGVFQLYACVSPRKDGQEGNLWVTNFLGFSERAGNKRPIISFRSTNTDTFFRAIWGKGYREAIQRLDSLRSAKLSAVDYPRYVKPAGQRGRHKRSGDVI